MRAGDASQPRCSFSRRDAGVIQRTLDTALIRTPPLCVATNGCLKLKLQKDKTMITKTLFAGLLTVGFLSAAFAVDAQAEPRHSQHVKNVGTTQGGARAGSMDSWPQTMDELTNAYNCGPYADKESAKKCKK
jgi:hypothetical protein